ncbi:MAG TPA: hypothetical protein PK261_03610, partial [Accumulibacter sp.]|nr:hypothetical protein [Accumulibacter sp.]
VETVAESTASAPSGGRDRANGEACSGCPAFGIADEEAGSPSGARRPDSAGAETCRTAGSGAGRRSDDFNGLRTACFARRDGRAGAPNPADAGGWPYSLPG